ncbi:cell division protein FtsX [Aquisediminimonas sediminicola]|uniref:cell division protein FtsX n=1 Tax=Alteraquisediminimonas sediminicola TaxID=2676787 RepID=UPI001C8DD1BF|nr:FtsX-like permease family protein [Aquisediminimonas sediminicola]
MIRWLRPPTAERQLLPETRLSGPMPWMLAIMMVMTILAGAATLAIGNAVVRIGGDLERRVTIQLIEPNPDRLEAQRAALIVYLGAESAILHHEEVGAAELRQLLAPWLGADVLGDDLPVPVMVDAELRPGARLDVIAARIKRVAPAARIDNNAAGLAPVADLLGTIRVIALMVMVMMLAAIMTAIVLAVRGTLNTHRSTIDVMHLMGATDAQLARHFQRRAALDALFGGLIGLAVATLIIALLGQRVAAMESELTGAASLGLSDVALLTMMPLAAAMVAALVARVTVIRTLRKML